MLLCAVAVMPMMFASQVTSLWGAVALIGLATAAHQGWSANLFTLTSDMFPRPAVGSVVGFGGMCGAIGGMLIAKVTGYILETTGSYVAIFIIAGSAYLAALLVIHLLVPRLEPVKLLTAGGSDPGSSRATCEVRPCLPHFDLHDARHAAVRVADHERVVARGRRASRSVRTTSA